MSMSLTIRRSDPHLIDGLSGEEAANFCFGFEDGKIVETDEMISFFGPWHIVHFLSSGTDWDKMLPAGFMLGGNYWAQHSPEEEPYRLLTAEEVSAVSEHLDKLTEEVLSERLHTLSTGTPQIYGGPLPAGAFDQARAAYDLVKDFVADATSRGQVITLAMA